MPAMRRTAVVTGASGGIGAATAERLDEVAAGITADGGQATVARLDVTDRPQVDALAADLPRCDVLVCNAGGAIGADYIADALPADWLTMYQSNEHGTHAIAATLRLELCGQPVRVIEIAPGLVKTEEFALNRYRGDAAKAAAVYAGVPEPLTAMDV